MQPVTATRTGGGVGYAAKERRHGLGQTTPRPPLDEPGHKSLAAFRIEAQHDHLSLKTVATAIDAPAACVVAGSSREHQCGVVNDYRPLRDFLSVDPVCRAVWKYVSNGGTTILIPLLRNPPDWWEVLISLRHFYIAASIAPYSTIQQFSPLHRVISYDKMFMTQLPVKETIEAVCRVIDYFQANLQRIAPKTPLVIAGIASGNAIYERAIVEYFRTQQQKPKCLANGLIRISDNLFLHCSDLYDGTKCYRSSPMLPVASMDYQKAVNHITGLLPRAAVLPFAAWIPTMQNGWFDALAQHPALIGFIHLRDQGSCGQCSTSFHTLREETAEHHRDSGLIQPGNGFWTEVFDVLGWGANDSLEDPRNGKIMLTTKLEVKYPHRAFGAIELPASLLYSDRLRSKAFCNLPIIRQRVYDSDSD